MTDKRTTASGGVTVIIGGQYGSEAKGKVASYLAGEFDIAVRVGSPNAGHTVLRGGRVFALRQVPATFVNPKCEIYIAAGALIDPEVLAAEVAETGVAGRLVIDPAAGVITEEHRKSEAELVGAIGSTGKGCGAALAARIGRRGFKLAGEALDRNTYTFDDTAARINAGLDAGKRVLVEGTQGCGLSLYHGDYPHVTSRDTTASGFISEAGLSPLAVREVILVIRTYPIRVAGPSGPLAGEITWEELSKRAGTQIEPERTTVTQKVRRIAAFDLAAVRRAVMLNRPTQIALQFLNYLFPADENAASWDALSPEARKYIEKLETDLGVPVTLVGTGRENAAMIDRR